MLTTILSSCWVLRVKARKGGRDSWIFDAVEVLKKSAYGRKRTFPSGTTTRKARTTARASMGGKAGFSAPAAKTPLSVEMTRFGRGWRRMTTKITTKCNGESNDKCNGESNDKCNGESNDKCDGESNDNPALTLLREQGTLFKFGAVARVSPFQGLQGRQA
jgi:hypothetical protein